jgi:spore photoproduct lyase
VLPAPAGYGVGGARNFYFSHMLNCVYDCRYCFLQGMYRSAHLVLFVNFEDFVDAMRATSAGAPAGEATWFFSGYDCDSLALEPLSGFAGAFLPALEEMPAARLELRTKSVQIRALTSRPPLPNCVVAYSLLPEAQAEALDHGAPALERRLDALARLQAHGWPVGLRFDPVLYEDGFEALYRAFFARVFARVDASRVHSVTVGGFRLPRDVHRSAQRLFPDERLFWQGLEEEDGVVSYEAALGEPLLAFCREELARHVPPERLFHCR